ncbi:protein chibby homolog 1-like [Eleutherodactylus coqui]
MGELDPPRVQLDNQTYVFLNGHWISELDSSDIPQTQASLMFLEKRNKILEEENNYLKIQTEVLKDYLIEVIAKVDASLLDMSLPVIEKTSFEDHNLAD